MINVFVNGIMQAPGIDYMASANAVAFTTPPSAGSIIQVQQDRVDVAILSADGSTYLYQMARAFNTSRTERLYDLMKDALEYSEKPAVAELLERLQVVVALIKQDG